jgi:hypothetical protein
VDSADEDIMRFEFDIQVEDHEDLVDGTKEWISAGNMYSLIKIWVGQLAVYEKRPSLLRKYLLESKYIKKFVSDYRMNSLYPKI